MANVNCSSCSDLREVAPALAYSGLDETMITSLENDTGLNPSSGNNDCTDLNNMNDCLVGNMDAEIEAYEVCDWKKYMHKFVPNVWTTLKAIIAAICGLWTNIKNILSQIDKLNCYINSMNQGATFHIGESPTAGSYIVAGKGISFLQPNDGLGVDVQLTYVAGGLMCGSGSLIWHTSDFTDAGSCYNFDNGSTERISQSRKGNPLFANTGRYITGGELLYEIRIKRDQYPQLGVIFSGLGHEQSGSAYTINTWAYEAGVYAPGNHGNCNRQTGEPTASGGDRGHLVPAGYVYVQVRLSYADMDFNNGSQYSPLYYMGVRMNLGKADC